MIINKSFWFKETPLTKQAFSYENPKNIPKFVKEYGGKAIPSLELSDFVAEQLPDKAEIFSVLVNSNSARPKVAPGSQVRPFKILVRYDDDSYGLYDEGHVTLKDANTLAKSIIKDFSLVLVYKEPSGNQQVEESLLIA